MERVIHKYPLALNGRDVLVLPVGSRILSAGNQREELVLWVEVKPEEQSGVEQRFYMAMTGEVLPEGMSAWLPVGTVQFQGGGFIVHVYRAPTHSTGSGSGGAPPSGSL